jgi:hypothetical protein
MEDLSRLENLEAAHRAKDLCCIAADFVWPLFLISLVKTIPVGG